MPLDPLESENKSPGDTGAGEGFVPSSKWGLYYVLLIACLLYKILTIHAPTFCSQSILERVLPNTSMYCQLPPTKK